ncbi:MAG: hypothetical protein ACFWT2_04930 [Thermoanaerobacterium thermosaccharolyticum]
MMRSAFLAYLSGIETKTVVDLALGREAVFSLPIRN